MGLFVARHQHDADTCPAKDTVMAPMLLQHLSNTNATQQGVHIHGEAVIRGNHTLYLILEADGRETVESFLVPFAMAGSVEVMAADPCEVVVDRGAC